MVRLTNGVVDVDVSTEFGPRVMRYRFCGGENMFAEVPHLSTPTPQGVWKPRGGHRLWVAPEHMPGSYALDDRPVMHEEIDAGAAVFRQPVDSTGIEKSLTVRLSREVSTVIVEHTVTNRSSWPIRVAPWAITIVAPGTVAIPQPPYRSHNEALLPAQTIVLWSYTDLNDSRWLIGPRLIRVTPDPARPQPQKIGVGSPQGWCALLRARTVFMKQVEWDGTAEYPDRGSNIEVFTAGDYLELETLGPLRVLAPDAAATHTERWDLFRDVEVGSTEESQDAALRALTASSVRL
jgi:hypothetical protein